jgi:type I restriction enzyme S subunit
MGLTKLGIYLELSDRRNTDRELGEEDVRGVSNNKQFMPTKANVSGTELSRFFVIAPGEFVYNSRTTRMGEKVGLGYNDSNETFLTSWNNSAFRVKTSAAYMLLPAYLYMFFNRPEFDRYARYNSWGSSTELFTWDDMCDIEIDIPSLPVQQKYVDVYNAMLLNQRAYESGLEDLKLTCDAYIERLRREMPRTAIGEYIRQRDERNGIGLGVESVRGLAVSKAMIETKADMNGVRLGNYKVVPPKHIAYVPDTSRRGDKMSLGFNGSDETYLVSSISTVFGTDMERLLPEYLMLFFTRSEFDRYSRFHSWGSARETFGWDDMREVKIPIPDIEVQRSIVNIYNAYLARREINEKMKAQIKNLCPILIKGSLEEAST